jgi:hypothetical protein
MLVLCSGQTTTTKDKPAFSSASAPYKTNTESTETHEFGPNTKADRPAIICKI